MCLGNVLVIGAMGAWYEIAYRPVLETSCCNKIEYLDTHGNVDYIVSEDRYGIEFMDILRHSEPDLVIITSPPETHYEYLKYSLACGADVICDKPLIAKQNQLHSRYDLEATYNELLALADNSMHKSKKRPCKVFTPFRRRNHAPFKNIIDDTRLIKNITNLYPSNIDLWFCDGSYRFHQEYDRPGAHGYRKGLGILTHTGYHFIDYLSALFDDNFDQVVNLSSIRLPFRTTIDQDGFEEIEFHKFLSDSSKIELKPSSHSYNAEADFRTFLQAYLTTGQTSNIHLFFQHHGFTRRMYPMMDANQTHDKDRVDDLVLTIQQGPYQYIQLQVIDNIDDSENGGYIRYVRRLHPKIAANLAMDELRVLDFSYPNKLNRYEYQKIVRRFIEESMSSTPLNSSSQSYVFSIQNQRLGISLYSCLLSNSL